MKFQKNEKNNSKMYLSLGSLALLIVVIILLLLKVRYLEAKNKFQAFGQVPLGTIKRVSSQDYVTGNPMAKVTIVEYSDFECPQCQYFHATLKKLLSYYGNNIRLVARMYPLPQNSHGEKEAEAALCAGKLGGNTAFWKYSEKFFDTITPTEGGIGLSLSLLPEFAKEAGINKRVFQKCLNSSEMAQRVQSEKEDGERGGINQLPGIFVIDGKGHRILLTGNQSFDVMKTIIDQALAL